MISLNIIINTLFLIYILSYYILILLPVKQSKTSSSKGVSIIVPVRNEEPHLREVLNSIINAEGKKEIIVVDDCSTDNSWKIISEFSKNNKIKKIRLKKHLGKAKALNIGLKKATYDYIAIIDGDTIIRKDSLQKALSLLTDDCGAVTSVVKVKSRGLLSMWLNIEQLYNSLIREALSKINANIVTPGPLSVYKKSLIKEIGGFSEKGYSEDVDVAVKILKRGKKIKQSSESVVETYMPHTFKGFIKQRVRFARGWIHIFKRHLRFGINVVDLYSLPMAAFYYIQAVIMSIFILKELWGGYYLYFLSRGILFNVSVLKFFLEWFSIVGIIKWGINIISSKAYLTPYTLIAFTSSLLTYPLYLLSIIKYDRLNFRNIFPLFFMFPFWFIIMIIYLANAFHIFSGIVENKWEKTF